MLNSGVYESPRILQNVIRLGMQTVEMILRVDFVHLQDPQLSEF